MDLRERKTLSAIKQAFLELRATHRLSRITVRELTERAQIGKATFYLHYHSVYDLSEQLQREVLEKIVEGVSGLDQYANASEQIIRELLHGFHEQRQIISILFEGEQATVLANSIEAILRESIAERYPNAIDDPMESALLTYRIQGAFHTYQQSFEKDTDEEAIVNAIVLATRAISEMTLQEE